MTPRQIELARHALGLPNKFRKSYRNRFVAGIGHDAWDDWSAMVRNGDAEREEFGEDRFMFTMTLAGARKALQGREILDREDFGVER